ncbi:hypothetical protein STCU_05532 [Strigomonas culicis]|uniref:Coiled-coil domain-containing protein n=1 Tax=Strigomonas culicis TaxID=28005 RepID=S9VL22_9TRYP|nr:hypothetical protein STCU_05532 [Strigomonas culicis]|eukprot:EPY27806.1 hypothetical protein STCU_05532 [Strigomonas culicis]
MSKSNKYFNRHSEEARARDTERADNAREARDRARADAEWVETDPKLLKKQEKQREEEQKAAERAQRKAEQQDQLQQEDRELAGAPKKVTQRQIQKDLSKMLADYDKQRQAIQSGQAGAIVDRHKEPLPVAGNANRQRAAAAAAEPPNTISASGGVGDAVDAMQRGTRADGGAAAVPDDRHIGKRAKVAYKAFFADTIARVRQERPGLRRTQYNNLVWDLWLKSPQNPFVRRSEARDQERMEEERRWREECKLSDEEDEEGEEDK